MEKHTGFESAKSNSDLYRLRKGKIGPKFPTSSGFFIQDWRSFQKSYAANDEIRQVARVARWFGARMASLRQTFLPVFPALSRADAIQHSIAAVNGTYYFDRTRIEKKHSEIQRASGYATPQIARLPVLSDATGQTIDLDSLATTVVDAAPNLLFEARKNNDPSTKDNGMFEINRSMFFANIESVYRSFWMQGIWENFVLRVNQKKLYFDPPSEAYLGLWPVWDSHSQLRITAKFAEAGFGPMASSPKRDFSNFEIPRSVKKVTYRDGKWAFTTIDARMSQTGLNRLAMNIISIEQGGLDTFFAATVVDDQAFTFLDLMKVWLALTDICEAFELNFNRWEEAGNALDGFSIKISRLGLCEIVEECSGLQNEIAEQAIAFLTVNLENASRLFTKSVWDCPIVPIDNEQVCLCYPPLSVGNVARAFEHWIARSQGDTSPELKGSHFERKAADSIRQASIKKAIPVQVDVLGPSIVVAGEEIDCVCRVGQIVFIIEAKCLITPGDPIERFNFLRKLELAGAQASRKTAACRALSKKAWNEAFPGWPNENLRPLVMVPGSYGVGLEFTNVPVIDLTYFCLLLTSLKLSVGAAKTSKNIHLKAVDLYKNGFSLAQFENNLRNPYQITRLRKSLTFRYEAFPSGSNSVKLFMKLPSVNAYVDQDILDSVFAKGGKKYNAYLSDL